MTDHDEFVEVPAVRGRVDAEIERCGEAAVTLFGEDAVAGTRDRWASGTWHHDVAYGLCSWATRGHDGCGRLLVVLGTGTGKDARTVAVTPRVGA